LDEGYIKPKVKKMSFLKIKNLSVDYPMRKETVYAAKGVNIEVNKGEILGLLESLDQEKVLLEMLLSI
jgi:ABC-type microcin C transport system duplicated ATPase subunit YejF